MERLKSLDPPHKGLRNALGKLALSAGKTDYTSLSSVTILNELANEVLSFKRLYGYRKQIHPCAIRTKKSRI